MSWSASPSSLIITDYLMPHLDGIRFTRDAQGGPPLPGHPGAPGHRLHGRDSITDKGLRKGVAMTLHKPVDVGQLLNIVRFAE